MLYDLGGNDPATPRQVQFADTFQAATLSALQPVIAAGQGVFSTSCCVHCLSVSSAMAEYLVNGHSMLAGAGQWYFNNSRSQDVSQCKGYDCVFACPPTGLTNQPQAEASQAMLVADGGVLPPGTGTSESDAPAAQGPAGSAISGAALWNLSAGRRLLRGV